MKKMFIFVAIVSLAFASCKKDEIASSNASDKSNVKSDSGTWNISKKGVIIEGIKCNELTNSNTKQIVYETVDQNTSDNNAKEATWTNSTRTDSNGKLLCDGPNDKNCLETENGAIIIKRNTSTN